MDTQYRQEKKERKKGKEKSKKKENSYSLYVRSGNEKTICNSWPLDVNYFYSLPPVLG